MINTVPLFPEERAALLSLLESLSTEQWRIKDVYPGWSLKDITSHLLADDFGRLSRGRDAYSGATFEPADDRSFDAQLLDFINRQNQQWVESARRLSPRLLIDLLRWSGERTQDYWQSLDLNAVGEPVSWAGPEPAPVWLDVAREFTERWLHQQHIREAANAPLLYDERIFGAVLDTFAYAIPHTYRNVPAPEATRVRLVLTGPFVRRYDAVRTSDGWRLDGGETGDAAASATMPADTAWRLFTKSLSPEEARNVTIFEGDAALAANMLNTVAIIA